MAVNQNLKNALADAGLTVEEFASILAVDPKSVGRWIAGTSTPYPRHRAAISRALALDEAELWPERASTPAGPGGDDHASSASAAAALISAWADSDDPSAPDPVEFITAADGPLDILDTDLWFDLSGPVAEALITRAGAGHQIRVASSAPRPNLAPLICQPGVQLRCVDVYGVALIREQSTMLIASPLGGYLDQPAALLLAHADGSDGLYERLSGLFDTAWNDPVDIITTADALEVYRTNAYDDLEDAADDDDDPELDAPAAGAPTAGDPLRSAAPTSTPSARRWPGSRGSSG